MTHRLQSPHAMLDHPVVQDVAALATTQGGSAYLVGGAVRDWLQTGALPTDLDFILVDCKAAKISKQLAETRQGHLVPLDWDFGIHRVVLENGLTVDLSDALENNLDRDLARRDLTLNAIALDLHTGQLLDPFQGQADLKAGRIRMVSAANLLDDPLRMLRVFRFAATLASPEGPYGLPEGDSTTNPATASNEACDTPPAPTGHTITIDPDTLATVRAHGADIWKSAAERIQYEFFRMLSAPRCFAALEQMADSGLLEILVPDLAPLRTVGGSGFHHLGLFDHTMELVRQAERLILEFTPEAKTWLKQPLGNGGTRYGLVKLACLLHDIGKPATMGERDDPVHGKRLTFYGHEEVGEQMADPWLRRLKVSNEVREYQKKLIRWHLYPCQFGPDSPRKSVLRFYRRIGQDTPDLLLLALADRFSACGPWLTPEDLEKARQGHLWLLQNYSQEQTVLNIPRLLNGNEVMQTLGLAPGPHLKDILEHLQEAQQLGEVHTPEEARAWLKAQYPAPL